MANQRKLDRLLKKATKAYRVQDRHQGARLIDQILQEDFNYAGAWQLLHRLYGVGRPIEEFQRSFALQYYPDKVALLQEPEEQLEPAPAPQKKPGFFARLFKRSAPPSGLPETEGLTQPESRLPASPSETTPEGFVGAGGAPPSSLIGTQTVPSSLLKTAPLSQDLHPASARAQPFGGEAAHPDAISPVRRPPPGQPPAAAAEPRTAASRDSQKIQVVVVDDIPQTRETVIRSLRFQEDIDVVGTATNGLQAIQLVKEVLPDVVIMDVNMPDMDGITATSQIKRIVPHAQIIILTVQDDIDYMRQAMMAGARDFLAKPPRIEELVEAVQKAAEIAKKERAKSPVVIVPAIEETPQRAGKILTIYSPRGGTGCTTLASNLAVALHSEDNPVILVDGSLQFGDLPVFFNELSKNTIADLAPKVSELDPDIIKEVAIAHSTGIRIISPPRPERAELVTGPHFSQLVTYLSDLYRYVIIDTSHRLTDVTLAALDSSDLILLVATQDVPSIFRMRKFFDLMPLLNLDLQRVMVVMNQFDQRVGITPEKVGQAFDQKIVSVLPLAYEIVIPSVNRGVPFMMERGMATRPIGRSMLTLADAMRQRLRELEKLPPKTKGQTVTP